MAPIAPPAVTVPAGTDIYRIHAASHPPRFYGRRDATWRWDDPAGGYGVLYAGLTPVGPFAETLLRRPDQRVLLWSEVARRCLARFRLVRPLRLADLHGAGLGWFGVDIAGIAATHDGTAWPGAYAATQAISALVHGHSDLDGIQYRSRLDTDHFCLALFDRADAALALVEDGQPIDRAWVDALLKPRGRHCIDP